MAFLTSLPPSLLLLSLTFVVAVITIVYVGMAESERSSALDRASDLGDAAAMVEGLLLQERRSTWARFSEWLASRLTRGGKPEAKPVSEKLLHAGFDSAAAQTLFNVSRVAAGVTIPLVGWILAPESGSNRLLFIGMSVLIGFVAPTAILDRLAESRRDRIRRGVPDALDLLVVCVEAGVSLDASILRVSRDMAGIHPELAFELGQVVRKVSAGMPRERALQQLPTRTGVEELRTLVASLIQCERLGSSIARVLRINAETLRLRRKQAIEKKAAEAALKMMAPLALFLLPALMIVVVGPAIIELLSKGLN
jgi:tight adherence protein C